MHIHVVPMTAFQVACSVADSIAKLGGGMRSATSSGSGKVYPGEQSYLIFVCVCVCSYILTYSVKLFQCLLLLFIIILSNMT